MRGPQITGLAATLPSTVPFVGPEAQERASGRAFVARLGANENAFGPSEATLEAMRAAAAEVWKYGDPENHDLKWALAEFHHLAVDRIVVGEGIDALLGDLVRLFVAPGDPVVTSAGAYPTFNYHATGFGGVINFVPYRNDHEDWEGLAEKAKSVGAKLVYLANPDNPMGTLLPPAAIIQMLEHLPDQTLLILDEAYGEFASSDHLLPMDFEHPNLIRMRTFSKAYGMAGARVGYAVGPAQIIGAFDKIRNHFGVNLVAQRGALAALKDQDHLQAVLHKNAAAKDRIAQIGQQNNLLALPSATNFVCLDCSGLGVDAAQILSALSDVGIFIRMPFVAPQNRCLRISTGPDAALDLLGAALPDAIKVATARTQK